jgi:hypothetical protein
MVQVRYLKSGGSITWDVFGLNRDVLTSLFIYLFIYSFIILCFVNISEIFGSSCLSVEPEKCFDEGSGNGQTCVLLRCDNFECFQKKIFILLFFSVILEVGNVWQLQPLVHMTLKRIAICFQLLVVIAYGILKVVMEYLHVQVLEFVIMNRNSIYFF